MILKIIMTWLRIYSFFFDELNISPFPAAKIAIFKKSVPRNKDKNDIIDIVDKQSYDQ